MSEYVTDVTPRKKGDWRWKFLDYLSRSSCVNEACLAAGVNRRRVYRHRERFPKFRKAWDEALVIATEALEAEARLRAFDRSDPASATLMIFLLKAHKPDKYRESPKPTPSLASGELPKRIAILGADGRPTQNDSG